MLDICRAVINLKDKLFILNTTMKTHREQIHRERKRVIGQYRSINFSSNYLSRRDCEYVARICSYLSQDRSRWNCI